MDWNNDGRKDLITGEYNGYIRIYLNTGTDANPVFTGYSYLQVAGVSWKTSYSIPEVTDWNNDGKKDVLVGNSSGNIMLLLNVGTDASPLFTTATYIMNGASALVAGARAGPVVADWNRDGKKDLLVGSSDGNVRYYENKGTDANPVFNGYSLLTAAGKAISVGYYSKPEVVDWDNDGWQDLLVGSYEGTGNSSDGHVFYFHALSGPYLKSYALREANGNGLLERGEQCYLTTVLTNAATTVTGVVATLSTTNPWCNITVSSWSLGDFSVYRSLTNSAEPFSFVIASNAPFGTALPFTLTITGNDGSYQQTHSLSFEVAQPQFSIASVLVNDSAGNGDCACNPGETVQLLVKLRNTGYRAEDVTGQLTASSTDLVMLNSNTAFGTIERNAQVVAWQTPFAFKVPVNMPSNGFYGFSLKLSYAGGSQTTNLPLTVGDYLVTSSTPYSWVSFTAPTIVSLTDESYRTVPLGFNFSFYGGRPTNYIHLVSNGYLMFGTAYSSYNVVSIPNTNLPNAIIAPWWEDLDPAAGGLIRYQVFGTAPNRYWVAEWQNVPRYYYTNYVRNFQVILYENGSIKFQYGSYSGSLGSRSIGLENATGTAGKAWTGTVNAGTALLCSVQSGSTDSDMDGLPDAWEMFYFGSLGYKCDDDYDHDGCCNLTEFRSGTDPTQSTSQLRIDEFRLISPTSAAVRWRSIPGRPYTVWLGSLADPQPALSLQGNQNGACPRIHVTVQTPLPYVLYAAPNLSDWSPLFTNSVGGSRDFVDLEGRDCDCRFYRVSLLTEGGWARLTPTPLVGAASGTNYYTNTVLPAASLLRLSTP